MTVPYSFANATVSIPLSQLDSNFNTPITLGNTAIQLGNTVTTLNNMTLANVTISSGNVTITNVSVTTANVTTGNITNMVSGNVTITGGSINGTTLGATTASTANVTTLTTSSTVTINGGTANGVAYLNASKVLTTGSALTFDGTNLVNTSSAVGTPEIAIANSATSAGSNARLRLKTGVSGASTLGDAFVQFTDSLNWNWAIGAGSSTSNALTFNQYFGLGSNELMRLTSTGLGIGTSSVTSGFKLDVNGLARIGSGSAQGFEVQPGALTQILAYNRTTSVYTPLDVSGEYLRFSTNNGAERMRLDSSGNLGLGVTPSAWSTSVQTALQVYTAGVSGNGGGNTASRFTHGCYLDGSTWKYQYTGVGPARYEITGPNSGSTHSWSIAAGGTAGNAISFTQAMTLDASGNLVLGTSGSASARLYVRGSGTTSSTASFEAANSSGATRLYVQDDGTTRFFGSAGPETARITSGGYFKASNSGAYINSTGTYHEINQTANDNVLFIRSTDANYSVDGVQLRFNRNTTNNTFFALSYYNDAAAAYKFRVADSGDVTNTNGTYGTISDQKMKTDIVDAGSQWADIKALRFRKFKMKNDPSGLVQLGVVAQEVELTSPGLVDEHQDRDAEGNDLGTTTKSVKTSVLLMKAAVALQEAMARIETLEAKIAALEAK